MYGAKKENIPARKSYGTNAVAAMLCQFAPSKLITATFDLPILTPTAMPPISHVWDLPTDVSIFPGT